LSGEKFSYIFPLSVELPIYSTLRSEILPDVTLLKPVSLAVLTLVVLAQPPGGMPVSGRDAIKGPHKGITTNGELSPGLFKVKSI